MIATIKAKQINEWAGSTDAPNLLPVLIRCLIHRTLPAEDIKSIDFPGYEQFYRPGVDGELCTKTGNAWVPKGVSEWELSTQKNVIAKIKSDFHKRQPINPKASYIAVTARNFPNKRRIEDELSIRVYDANNIEQWLEQSSVTALWLSEKMGQKQSALQISSQYWNDWSQETKPAIPINLLLQKREEEKIRLLTNINDTCSRKSIHIAADTRKEAIAFICACVEDNPAFTSIIVDSQEGISQLKQLNLYKATNNAIVIATEPIARDLPDSITKHVKLIVAEARNERKHVENTIILPRVDNFDIVFQDFETSKQKYAITRGSISALWRNLANNRAKRHPNWLPKESHHLFLWLTLVGGWDEAYDGDKDILKKLSGIEDFSIWQTFAQKLIHVEDAPLKTSNGDKQAFRLFQRIDAFQLIVDEIIPDNVDRFLELAQDVVTVTDPGLLQPRHYSDFLRDGIVNGIAILSVQNEHHKLLNTLPQKIKKFYNEIFKPEKAWYSMASLLPKLAEARPEDFLIELRTALDDRPDEIRLLFHHPSHISANLLWALEGLAWKPDRLEAILDYLCLLQHKFEQEMARNIHNRPSNSMRTILHSWLPQTHANIEQRKCALAKLFDLHPAQAAELALSIARYTDNVGYHNYTPLWRDDALGIKRVTFAERSEMIFHAIDRLEQYIRDNKHCLTHKKKLCLDMFASFDWWGPEKLDSMYEAILSNKWDAKAKAELYSHAQLTIEQIKYHVKRKTKFAQRKQAVLPVVEKIYKQYTPEDLIEQNLELFDRRQRHFLLGDDLGERRRIFIVKLFDQGISAFVRLVANAKQPEDVAITISQMPETIPASFLKELLVNLIKSDEINDNRLYMFMNNIFSHYAKRDQAAQPFTANKAIEIVKELFSHFDDLSSSRKAAVLHSIRLDEKMGRDYIDEQPEEIQRTYFSRPKQLRKFEHIPEKNNQADPEMARWLAKYYLKYKRPRLAFQTFHLVTDIPPYELYKLLRASYVDSEDDGPPEDSWLAQYDLVDALRYLENNLDSLKGEAPSNQDMEKEIVLLETCHLDPSESSKEDQRSNPWLVYRELALNPYLFIQILFAVKSTTDQITTLAAHKIIDHWRSPIPGQENDTINKDKLKAWVSEARSLGKKHNIAETADYQIGAILANSPVSSTEIEPDQAVCQILEELNSKDMFEGFVITRINNRGAFGFPDGKDNQGYTTDELRQKYHDAECKLRNIYPNVAKNIMKSLADDFFCQKSANNERESRSKLRSD